jgi:hypothetical protein
MGRNTMEGKKGSLFVTVHLSLSSDTLCLVSTIDICSQGCHLQREDSAHRQVIYGW